MSNKIDCLEMRDIVKRFPGVLSNDHVGIKIAAGEILALLGENGAGKTTLMNVLYGLYQPDGGGIFINGNPVRIDSPRSAIDKGIGRGIKQLQAHPPVLLVNPHVKILIRLKNGFSVIDVGAGVENSQYTLTKKRVAAARANLTQLLNFTL